MKEAKRMKVHEGASESLRRAKRLGVGFVMDMGLPDGVKGASQNVTVKLKPFPLL
jgi:hypothetical protein